MIDSATHITKFEKVCDSALFSLLKSKKNVNLNFGIFEENFRNHCFFATAEIHSVGQVLPVNSVVMLLATLDQSGFQSGLKTVLLA